MAGYGYSQVTLATIRALVLTRLSNSAFYSASELNYVVNESIRIFQLGTGYWTDRFVYPAGTVAGRVWYDLTQIVDSNRRPTILMPKRVLFNGVRLNYSTVNDMDWGFPGWQTKTTATAGVPNVPITWGNKGVNLAFIYPADANGGNSLTVDAITRAPALVSDGDFINIDQSALNVFLDYMFHVCQFKRGGLYFRQTVPMWKNFLRMMAKYNGHLSASGIFKRIVADDTSLRTRPRRATQGSGVAETVGAH